ncbi:MAG: hypothetical protein ACM4D3_18245 [Candidatus Sericytochromatia bacterium]
MRYWTPWVKAAAAVFLGFAAIPGAVVIIQTPGVASADVCASVGRRVSVSGCANIADTIADYVPPPSYYAPMPEDEPPPEYTAPPPPPPPPPAPNVSVCANVGRRVNVSGCI